MENNTKIFHTILYTCILLFSSCNQNDSIQKKLALDCKTETHFENIKTIQDIQENFKIEIPSHWKKEFYVDQNISRLYCADTVKELNDTYILDITHIANKSELDSVFIRKASKKIVSEHQNIVKSGRTTFKNKSAYFFHTKLNSPNFESEHLKIHIDAGKKSYYKIDVQVFGPEDTTKRFCESLAILQSLSFE